MDQSTEDMAQGEQGKQNNCVTTVHWVGRLRLLRAVQWWVEEGPAAAALSCPERQTVQRNRSPFLPFSPRGEMLLLPLRSTLACLAEISFSCTSFPAGPGAGLPGKRGDVRSVWPILETLS